MEEWKKRGSFSAAFERLARQRGWDKLEKSKKKEETKEYHKLRRDFIRNETKKGFTEAYGADPSKLKKWQKICRHLEVEPVPDSIAGCKKVRSQCPLHLLVPFWLLFSCFYSSYIVPAI